MPKKTKSLKHYLPFLVVSFVFSVLLHFQSVNPFMFLVRVFSTFAFLSLLVVSLFRQFSIKKLLLVLFSSFTLLWLLSWYISNVFGLGMAYFAPARINPITRECEIPPHASNGMSYWYVDVFWGEKCELEGYPSFISR